MFSKAFKALFFICALLLSIQSFSQCFHCSAPSSPASYGGTFNATMYKNTVLQLWAAKPSVAVDGRQWYRVKKAGDTTFVGYGDTMVFTMDTTSKFICRNVNNCTCGGTYYSSYTLMSTIAVVDSPSIPRYWFTFDSVICSGSPTNIYTYTNSSLSGLAMQYLRDDTPNVTGSAIGSAALGPLGVTLTNTTGSAQTVRILLRFSRGTTYFDSKSFYVKVLPTTPSSGDHCSFPSKPNPWPNNTVDVYSYGKGAHVQFLADTTVIADTVKWYKVVGTDTSYVGRGYSIAVTMDTTAKYLARSFNVCNCSSGNYSSPYSLMANNTVSANYVSHIIPLQIMDTIASGTGINILTKTDTNIRITMVFWRDNANVTGSINQNTIDNYTGTEGFDAILTNTTNVPQRIRYKIFSTPYATPGPVYGDTYTGYFTVMPSTFTAPSGNHCYIPPRENSTSPPVYSYSPDANVYLDLNHWGFINGAIWTNLIAADAVEWYRVRGPGDTVFVGDVTPVSTTVDTTIRIFTVSRNICYWSDSSRHIYRSVPTYVGQLTKSTSVTTAPTHVNNKLNVCSGSTPDITYTGTTASIAVYRSQPRGSTGAVSMSKGFTTSFHPDSIVGDTISSPLKIYYVGFRNVSSYGSNVLDSIIVYPNCSKWANFSTAIHAVKDSICPGDTATLTADTVPGLNNHYAWSTGDTTKTIHPTVAGTYSVTVTNSCGCSATSGKILFMYSINLPKVPNDTICLGTRGVLTVTAGKSYLWSTGDTSQTIGADSAGSFSVVVADSFGCRSSAIGEIIIAIPSPIDVMNDTICLGDTAILRLSGAYSCLWGTGDSTMTIQVGVPGSYSVVAIDSAGCKKALSAQVVQNSQPQVAITAQAACLGDSAILTASGGNLYLWSDGSSTPSIRTKIASTYTVTATSSSGCSATATSKSEIDTLKIAASDVSFCAGTFALAVASGADYYKWSTGDSTAVLRTSISGSYTVTGTNALGCRDSITISLSSHGPVAVATNDSISYGDTATLYASGGTAFLWSTGASSSSIKVLESGQYDVTVTDSLGCFASSSGSVYVDPITAPQAPNDTINQGDTAILQASGGLSYIWSNGDSASRIRITPVNTTPYSVTITGLNWTKVIVPKVIVHCRFSISTTDTSLCFGQEATLAATVTGAFSSLSYQWSNGNTMQTISVDSGAAYSVSVTDQSGCSASAVANVSVSKPVSVGSVAIFPGGTATLVATGGYYYTWSNGSHADKLSTSVAGSYSVTATDTLGCLSSATGTVSVVTLSASSGGSGQYIPLLSTKSTAPSLNSGLPVGLTPGYSSVTPQGSASYSIPIALPPGTNGMAPKLSLEYNSNSGNGLMGWGWSINGLSSITRAGHNNHVDKEATPISLGNTDHFVLDGQILTPVNGSNGAPGTTYGLESEDYSLIKSLGNTGSYDGPEWFQITTKSGLTLEYGNSVDSRILSNSSSLPSDLVFSWRISKIYDRDGNYVTFKYETSSASPKISEISYTGNDAAGIAPYNTIAFHYLSRVDNNISYSAGSSFNSDFVLSDITISGENGAAYKKYELDYGSDDLSSYLSKVTEFGSDGSHLNPTSFTYGTADDLNSYATSSYDFQGDISSFAKSTYSLINYRLLSGDFNGDGYSDVLTIGNAITPNSGKHISHNVLNMIHFMDPATNQFYKVSEEDKLLSNDAFRASWYTALYEGIGSTGPLHWFPEPSPYTHGDFNYYVGDFLGNGRAGILEIKRKFFFTPGQTTNGILNSFPLDLIGVDSIKFTTYDNNGIPTNHFWPAPNVVQTDFGMLPEQWFYQGDFDGDGTQDYIISTIDNAYISFPRKGIFNQVLQNNMTGMGTIAFPSCGSLMNPQCELKRMILDFDGDGKSDVMIIDKTRSKVFSVQKNSSGSYSFEILSGSTDLNSTDYNGFYLGDFNGDGKADLLTRKYSDDSLVPVIDPLRSGETYYNMLNQAPLLGGHTLGALHVNWDIWHSTGKEFTKTPFKAFAIDPRTPSFNENDAFNNPYTGGFTAHDMDLEKAKIRDACIGDFNGDGKSDILFTSNLALNFDPEHWFYYGCGDLTMYYSAGASFKEYKIASGLNFMSANYSVEGDFNGDGRTDLSFYNVKSTACTSLPKTHSASDDYFQFSFNPKSLQRLLVQVVDGFDQKRTFNYKPLTNAMGDVHTRGSSSTYPSVSVQLPLYVVSQTTEPDGASSITTVNYTYENARFHLGGRGFLGFYAINATTIPSNIGTSAYYAFDAPFYVPINFFTSTYNAGSLSPISGEDNDYSFLPLTNGRFALQRTHTLYTDYITAATVETYFAYDSHGNLTQTSKNTNGIETETTQTTYTPSIPYNPSLIITHRTRSGSSSDYTDLGIFSYNNKGKLISSLSHVGKDCSTLTQVSYNALGNTVSKVTHIASSMQSPRSELLNYDQKGRFAIRHINGLLQAESFEYDPLWGKVVSQTDIAGLRSQSWLDPYGRLILQKTPRGTFTDIGYSWDLGGHVTTSIYLILTHQPGVPDVTEWFDAKGRNVAIKKTGFNNSDLNGYTFYDNKGKAAIEIQPAYSGESGRFKITDNDIYGRPTSINDQFGTTFISYSYPGDGSIVTTTTSPAGHQRKVTKDATGKVVKSVDDGGTLAFKYDGFGNQTQVTLDGNVIQSISYDECGNKNQVVNPNSGTTSSIFDAFGQLASETDALGNTHSFRYDALGRMTYRYGAEGTTTYSYKTAGQNGLNKISTISVAGVLTNSFQYDVFGANTETVEVITGHTITTQHQYDANTGALAKDIYNSGVSVKYEHDASGYLTKIIDENTATVLYKVNSLNCFGQATSYTTGNSLTSSLETNFGVPTRYYTPSYQDLRMTYDWTTQNMTQRQDVIASLTENFSYDSNDRLLSSQVVGQAAMPYTYYSNGNLSSKAGIGTFSYDAGKTNAVRHISNTSGLVSSNEQDIAYTSFSQPSVISEDGYELTYLYGPTYNRNYSTLKHSGSVVGSRLYSGNYEINYDASGNYTEQHYIYGNNGLVAIIVKSSTGTLKEYYTYCDHLQSILTVLDDTRSVAAQQNFDAWGRYRNPADWTYSSIPPVSTDPLVAKWMYRGYTGHEHLPEFVLINMNGRMYDPLLGRMLGPDKVINDPLNTQCYNSYTYANNNPLKFIDPSGWDYDDPYSFYTTEQSGDAVTTNITMGYGQYYTTVSYTYVGGTLSNVAIAINNAGGSMGSGELSDDGLLSGSGILFNANLVIGAGQGVYSIMEGFHQLGGPNAIPIAAENLKNNFLALVQVELPWKITDDPDVGLAGERMGRAYVNFWNSLPQKTAPEWGNMIGKTIPFVASMFTGSGEASVAETVEITPAIQSTNNAVNSTALALYWPANGGALGAWEDVMAQTGQVFDRFGNAYGTYMSPVGTPFEMRALSPSTDFSDYFQMEVLKPFPMRQSVISPAFNQIGLGVQFQAPVSIYYLEEFGYIRIIH